MAIFKPKIPNATKDILTMNTPPPNATGTQGHTIEPTDTLFPSLNVSPTDKPPAIQFANTDDNNNLPDDTNCSTMAILMMNTHDTSAFYQPSLIATDTLPSLIESPTDKSTDTNTTNNDPPDDNNYDVSCFS